MGDSRDKRILSIPALSRSFRLGMLYDCRSDSLIDGPSLWSESTLTNRAVEPHETTEFQVTCSDSLDSKASSLNIDASLKLSFLCGLVEVQGAAKYLSSEKSSNQNEFVTLQYKCTKRVERLTMDHLGPGKIEYPQVLDQNTATHVVTSIVYGAQAFFLFERKCSTKDKDQDIQGQLLIEKIPLINVTGEGKLKMTEEEIQKTEEFSCTFIGDFRLNENPASFIEAVKVYKQLPQLLCENGERGIPFTVTLYPLALIDQKTTRIVREISVDLLNEVEIFFDRMQNLSIRCRDNLESETAKGFDAIRQEIDNFTNLIKTHKLQVQKELSMLLPDIRGSGKEEQCLVDLLDKINQSPVSSDALTSWLNKKEAQIMVLNEYILAMAGITLAKQPGFLESVVMKPGNTYCLCLMISVPSNDFQLKEMKRYCFRRTCSNSNDKVEQKNLPTHHTDRAPMMVVAGAFRDFYNTNKNKNGISFLVAQERSECDDLYARVQCYENGILISDDYELPTSVVGVKAVTEKTTHNSITITWKPPKYGSRSVLCYGVSHCNDTVNADVHQVTIPNLVPNTEYEVQVWPICAVGNGPVKGSKVLVKTKPANQPKILQATLQSTTQIFLKWNAPSSIGNGCRIDQYIIKQNKHGDQWEEILHTGSSDSHCIVENPKNTVTEFKITASCGTEGLGYESEPFTVDLSTLKARKTMKQKICENSDICPAHSQIYVPKLKLISRNAKDMSEGFELGKRDPSIPERVIMLLGATGSGKTTLINGFVNYIFGVDWKDPFRFKMILEPNEGDQAQSQTKKITSYTLHHQKGINIPYTLTIIDTPGFGDVKGIKRDKEIADSIHKFFTSKENYINNIDAVCFVVNSSLPRLTPTQQYIFDQVLSLFGKDIANNIFLLLTFADGKEPQVLSGIKKANIPHQRSYKFNNSALYVFHSDNQSSQTDSDEEDKTFDQMFWNMGVKSFDRFLKDLKFVETKSLHQIRDVLNERNVLQVTVAGLQQDIRQGLCTLERLTQEMKILEGCNIDIEKSKDFEYEYNETISEQVDTPRGRYVTNCLTCNRTCHDNCSYPENKEKINCSTMSNGRCIICPSNCIWSVHVNNTFMYAPKIRTVKKTIDNLRQSYEAATKQKLDKESLITEIQGEFDALHVKILGMTHTVSMSIKRLEEIALRRNPLSTVGYVEILIQNEKEFAEPGWQTRLEHLTHVKEEAKYMEQIAKQGFDPFKEYMNAIPQLKSKSDFFKDNLAKIKKKYNETNALLFS